jgi:hypothetical protein
MLVGRAWILEAAVEALQRRNRIVRRKLLRILVAPIVTPVGPDSTGRKGSQRREGCPRFCRGG